MNRRWPLAVCVVLAVAAPARADDWINPYTGSHWNNPTSDLIDSMIRDQMNANMLRDSLARHPSGDKPVEKPVKHLPYTKTDFAGAKKHLVVDGIIASLVPSPEQQRTLGTAMDQVFAAFEKQARKNNVAYALAFMVGAAVTVTQKVELTDAQSEELAAGINDALGQNAGFAKASAKDRQKLYETFVTLGGLILMFAEVGKQDAASAKAASALATLALAIVGVK